MTFEDFQKKQALVELEQEMQEKLNELSSLVRSASSSRSKLNNLLRLPAAMRIQREDENGDLRTLLRRDLEGLMQEEAELSQETRGIVLGLLEGIDIVDQISNEIEAVKSGKKPEDGGPDDPEPNGSPPESTKGESPEADAA